MILDILIGVHFRNLKHSIKKLIRILHKAHTIFLGEHQNLQDNTMHNFLLKLLKPLEIEHIPDSMYETV